MRRETVVGATGPGSRTLSYPRALNQLIGTKFKAPPGLPAERVAELRAAFDTMLRDPELLSEASRQGLDIGPGQQDGGPGRPAPPGAE